MEQLQYTMKTTLGPLYVVASDRGVRGVFFDRQPAALVKDLRSSQPVVRVLRKTVGQIEEYLAGQRKQFDVVLDCEGTSFQKQVWNELSKIPFGATLSYKDIARRIKNPKAVRAVGSANGKNPVCIIVPCHRVIASNGTIGGYSGGVNIKRALLDLEQGK